MVSVVFLVAQNESGRLEEPDDRMRLLISHVSPLMNFVGENSQNDTKDNCPTVALDEEIG